LVVAAQKSREYKVISRFLSSDRREICQKYLRFIKEFEHKVSATKNLKTLQEIADNSPKAKNYHSDGYQAYSEAVYCGSYRVNCDKSETYTVEGVNSDLRKYIPIFAGKSKCFARKISTAIAVVAVFVRAFNQFALKKFQTRKLAAHYSTGKKLHKYKDSPFSIIDFILGLYAA
jgi:IS1 family transposase